MTDSADHNDRPVAILEQTDPFLQMATEIANNPDSDVAKIQAILDMRTAERTRESVQAFNAAMAAVQAELEPIVRDATNDQTRSSYATLEMLSKQIKPITTKHGFATSFGTDTSPIEMHYRITATLSHVEGHYRDYHVDIPIDAAGLKGNANKTATHAFGSTMTYGRRYLTLLIWDIATEDDDGNAVARQDTLAPDQIESLDALLTETGTDEAQFLSWLYSASEYKPLNLEAVLQKDFSRAHAALKGKARIAAKPKQEAKENA